MGEHQELETSEDTNECYKTEAIELNEKPSKSTRPCSNEKCFQPEGEQLLSEVPPTAQWSHPDTHQQFPSPAFCFCFFTVI